MRRFHHLLAALPIVAAAAAADAGSYLDLERWGSVSRIVRDTDLDPWKFNLGAGVGYAPVYQGSDELEVKPVPVLDISYRDRFFLSSVRGLGYNFFSTPGFRVGPRLTVDWGRDSSDSAVLAGLADVEPGVEAGFYFEGYYGAMRFRGDIRQELLDGHGGTLLGLDFAFARRLGERSVAVFGVNLTGMGDAYADAYFSTTGSTAGLAGYTAEAGLRDLGAYVQFVFPFESGAYVGFDGRANVYGDVADSPLVEEDLQLFVGTVAGIRF